MNKYIHCCLKRIDFVKSWGFFNMFSQENLPWTISKPLEFLNWAINTCKVDPILRSIFGFCFWIIFLYIGQFLAYRNIQVALFEVPPDWFISQTNGYEVFQSFKLFPGFLIFSPLITFPFIAFFLIFMAQAEKVEKGPKGKRYLTALFQSLAFIALFLAIPTYKITLDCSTEYALTIFVAVVSFLSAMASLNKILTSPQGIGKRTMLLFLFMFCSVISLSAISEAQTKEEQAKKYRAEICKDITPVAIKINDNYRLGWLISRGDSSVLLRELKNKVYRTIEVKTNDVKDYIYMRRFGSNEEKNNAFPACAESV